MDAAMLLQIQSKINALPKGTQFDVKTLMGNDWVAVLSKQTFGRKFKMAIADGKLTGIIHDHLDNSPRRDIYKKAG
jgi:hypothetical protein